MPIDDDSMKRIRRRQAAFDRRVKAIRADPNLSAHGKRRAMAVERHAAVTDIENIKAAAAQAYTARKQELERRMFGVHDHKGDVSALVSYRDAQDRVAEIKNGAEAQLMMRRAIRNGDTLLARALFDRGWEQSGDRIMGSGWGEVVKAYVADVRPDLAESVNELGHLQHIGADRTRRLTDAMETGVHMPPEMEGMSTYDQQRAATEAADTEGVPQ